jgi:putative heme transporter
MTVAEDRGMAITTSSQLMWLVVAVVLQFGSMGAFAFLQCRVLADAGLRLRPSAGMAIAYESNAMSVTIPFAGSTAGTAFAYRQYVRRGASAAMAGWTLAIAGLFSTLTFGLLVGAGALASGNPLAAGAGVLSIVACATPVLAGMVALRRAALRRRLERLAVRVLKVTRRLRRRASSRPEDAVAQAVIQLRAFRMTRWHVVAASSYAALNWLFDALCLWAVLQAFHVSLPLSSVPLLYAAVVAAASIGVTPAGIGTVEVAIAAAIAALGGSSSHALLAAVAYRAISTWLVLTVGWVLVAHHRRASTVVTPGSTSGGSAGPLDAFAGVPRCDGAGGLEHVCRSRDAAVASNAGKSWSGRLTSAFAGPYRRRRARFA